MFFISWKDISDSKFRFKICLVRKDFISFTNFTHFLTFDVNISTLSHTARRLIATTVFIRPEITTVPSEIK